MADTFCRIVDTTICDQTLGSDGTQSVLTTDASTSFVIRDIYKEDSCTCTFFSFKGALVMDGQCVHENLETTASGSLIVPPSSNLCYKDTSGNYPLLFEDVEEQMGPTNGCLQRIRRYEAASGVVDGSKTLECRCTANLCCFGDTSSGVRSQLWLDCNNNVAWYIYSDGNSTNSIRQFCYTYSDAGATCSTQTYCTAGAYCQFDFNDCVVIGGGNNCVKFWSHVCGTGPCCCFIKFVVSSFANNSYSTYSDIGVSSIPNSKSGYHKYCRGWVTRPGGNCACPITWGHVNLCCICAGNCACGGCIGCVYPPDFSSSCICSEAQNANKLMGIWWNACCCNWFIYWTNSNGERIFLHAPGLRDTSTDSYKILCTNNFVTGANLQPGENTFMADDGCRLYSIISCACKAWSVVLDDLWENGEAATFTTEDYSVSSSCFKNRTDLMECPRGYAITSVKDTARVSSASGIDPTTKLTFYGIKSTT